MDVGWRVAFGVVTSVGTDKGFDGERSPLLCKGSVGTMDFGQQSFDLTQELAGNGSGASAREGVMNKVVLAFAVTALVGAAISPLDAREFRHSGCAKAAEIKFPTDRIARKEFKH